MNSDSSTSHFSIQMIYSSWMILKIITQNLFYCSPTPMKKVHIFQQKTFLSPKKDGVKRSNTIAKTNFINKPIHITTQTFKYYVGNGNNSYLIRKIMSTRKNWQQLLDSKNILVNIKWQQTNKGYIYECNTVKKPYRNIVNHYQFHQELTNKQYLFKNMLEYCELNKMNVFDYTPLTFILNVLQTGFQIQQSHFINFFHQLCPPPANTKPKMSFQLVKKPILTGSITMDKKIHAVSSKYEARSCFLSLCSKPLWILKPTFLNRGNGIHVFNSLGQLQTLMNKYIRGTPEQPGLTKKIEQSPPKKNIQSWNTFIIQSSSFVIQKYMQRPLLFNGRKFDIRVWVLLDHQMKVHIFKQGYVRTSSQLYSLGQDTINDLQVHLTNNSVQMHNPQYNKFEKGNQLSFRALRTLLEGKGKDFDQFMTEMKQVIKLSFMSVRRRINRMDRDNCFQIFGYDFMIDDITFKPWLIEVNTNPSLQQSSPLLQQLLPRMLDDAFALTLDKIFPSPKTTYSYTIDTQPNNQNLWQMILDIKKQ